MVANGKKISATGPTTITSEIDYDWEVPRSATVVRSSIKIKGVPQIFTEEFFYDDGGFYGSSSAGEEYSFGDWSVSENKIYLSTQEYEYDYYYNTAVEIATTSFTYTVGA